MGMDRIVSRNQEKQDLRLLLIMQLRPADEDVVGHPELSKLARDKPRESERKREKEPELKIGERRTFPVTTTSVQGVGVVSGVYYGIITFDVTPTGFSASTGVPLLTNREAWARTYRAS